MKFCKNMVSMYGLEEYLYDKIYTIKSYSGSTDNS